MIIVKESKNKQHMINKHDIGSIADNNNNNERVTRVIILVTINR